MPAVLISSADSMPALLSPANIQVTPAFVRISANFLKMIYL